MSKKEVYVVTMYRWANRENHSYVLGVWNKKFQAMKAATEEEQRRGGKYTAEIIEANLDVAILDEANNRYTLSGSPTIGRENFIV